MTLFLKMHILKGSLQQLKTCELLICQLFNMSVGRICLCHTSTMSVYIISIYSLSFVKIQQVTDELYGAIYCKGNIAV